MDVKMPDGKIVSNVPDNITQSELLRRYSLFNQPQEKPEDVGIIGGGISALKRGFESFGDIAGGYRLAGKSLAGNLPGVTDEMVEMQKQQPVENPALTFADLQRIYKEKGLGSALAQVPKYAVEQTLQSAPQMAVPLAVGEAAAALSGPFAPIVGPLAGIGTYGLQQFGSLMQRQGQEKNNPEDINVGKAATAAAIQAPIGYFADKFTAGIGGLGEKGVIQAGKELAARKAAGEIGTAGVVKGVAKRAGVGAIEGFIAEAPTEALEQVLERWQAGLPLDDDKAKQEYLEAFMGAGVSGAFIGAGAKGYDTRKEMKKAEEEAANQQQFNALIQQAQQSQQAPPAPPAGPTAGPTPPSGPNAGPPAGPIVEPPTGPTVSPEEEANQPAQDTQAMMAQLSGEPETIPPAPPAAPPALSAPPAPPLLNAPPETKPEPKLPPKIEKIASFPMGENTDYHVLKTPTGYTANLFDNDSGKYVSGSTRMFSTKTFGDEAQTKAVDYAKDQAEKAAKFTKPESVPYTLEPPDHANSYAKYSFTDENGARYNVSGNGDVHVAVPPALRNQTDGEATVVFREKERRKGGYSSENLPAFVPPAIRDAIANHVKTEGNNGQGLNDIAKAVKSAQESEAPVKTETEQPELREEVMPAKDTEEAISDQLPPKDVAQVTPEEEAAIQPAPHNEPLPTTAPSVSVDKAQYDKAKADLDAALGDLGMFLTKGSRLNIMPEDEQKIMPILTRVMDAAFQMGYYKFKEAAKFVLDMIKHKLGKEAADQVSLDHLQGAYISMAGKYQDKGASNKKEVISVESLNELHDQVPISINTPEGQFAIAQEIAKFFVDGGQFKNINEARAKIAELTGQKVEPGTAEAKQADEAVEVAVVLAARQIIEQGGESTAIYDKLVDLYNRQPNLSVRSSTSIANQAYSTPAPLAFVASQLAGINKNSTVYEPTAGNGMLLIGANEKNVTANELNPGRHAMLERILPNANVTNENVLTSKLTGNFDVVIENPPFGKAGDISDIDHVIAMQSLATMKADGKAVLIVGSVMSNTEEGRRSAYRGQAKREFFFNLYNQYNVVDHFTAGGNMYAKQGTTFPVDVIVIDGKGKSSRDLPAADLPQLITSYEQLKEKLNERTVVSRGNERPAGTNIMPSTEGQNKPEGVGAGTERPSNRPGEEGAEPTEVSKPSVSEARPATGGEREPTGGRTGEVQPKPNNKPERVPGEGPIPSTSETKPTSSEGTERNKPEELGGVSVVSGERVESGLKNRAGQETETENQVSYAPHSNASSVGTLVPKAMAQAIEDSLAKLEEQHGSIDEYVADNLNMEPETLRNNFSAEQIDAIALAIKNAEEGKGFIIGDQTGVGKGRVVAAMIKYALINDKIPIFVTEKPNLYSDMIRDLDDIGMTDQLGLDTAKPKILITNRSQKIPYTLLRKVNGEMTENNLTLKSPVSGAELDDMLKDMRQKDSIGDYKVIFTIYTQLQTQKGAETERQRFIKHFGAGNYMIFDESHNAGGAGETQARTKEQKDAAKEGKSLATGRASFVRNLVQNAFGTFFSSATYAKRPDVMDLYSSTDMKLAVDKIAALADAIKNGGIPMQQTVAKMLTQVGQYIRRERTFAGVSYDTKEAKVDKATAENMATSMRDILAFSRGKESAVKELQGSLDTKGSIAKQRGEKTQIQSANFGSTMHTLIDQMLLSLKAKDSVNHAIERLKANEKVVITVANTMGSFLQSYADEMGLNTGDQVNLSFKDLYLKYLEKQRTITIKKPDGQKEQYRLTDENLGPELVKQYNDIKHFIENAGFGEAPISPIDYMHDALRKAGFKTEEITGRTLTIDYAKGKPVLASRSANIKQRVNAVKAFNNGDVSVIILNQAGSTGLSLHASDKVHDKRKRHMIIAQPEKNIDTHMQMLGRVHRTGQVVTPAYSQMMADIPAEMRPAAVLLKKMASLNANTTGSRKSAVAAEGAVDFINDYGGQVAQEYLRDNHDIHEEIGGQKAIELIDDPTEALEADIKKFTGYIPILPIKQQEEVYKDLIERYKDLIEREDSMGTNKLEAKAVDLDAQTISSKPITEDKGDPSAFAQPAYMEKVDVKRTVKPFTKDEVKKQVEENLGGTSAKDHATNLFAGLKEKASVYLKERIQSIKDPDEVKIQNTKDELNSQYNNVKTVLQAYPIGTPITVKSKLGGILYGVITNVEHKGKTKNPMAGSDWKLQIALANGDAKTIPVSFSQIGINGPYTLSATTEGYIVNSDGKTESVPLLDMFDRGSTAKREKRWMVTGNLLAGFAAVDNMGQIISYTKQDGSMGQGIMMPRIYDFEKAEKNAPVKLKNVRDVKAFFDKFPGGTVQTQDGIFRIFKRGDVYQFNTVKAKREGGPYYNNQGLTDIIGDFHSTGPAMNVRVWDSEKAERAIQYMIQEMGTNFVAGTNKEEARQMFAAKAPYSPGTNNINLPKAPSINPTSHLITDTLKDIERAKKIQELGLGLVEGMEKFQAINKFNAEKGTAKQFFELATKSWNNGNISDDVYDTIKTMYEKFPNLLEQLQFKTVGPSDPFYKKYVAGSYEALERIVRLYKGTTGATNPLTIRHEIVHSLEQMMGKDQAKILIDQWMNALEKTRKSDKTPEGKLFFDNLAKFYADPTADTYAAAIESLPAYSYYQYMNPSEYWAVNAEKMLARKLGTKWDQFANAVKKFFEFLKYKFGFDNQYNVHKIFDEIMNAKAARFTDQMLSDYVTSMNIAFNNRTNFRGDPAPLSAWGTPEASKLDDWEYKLVDKHVDTRRIVQTIQKSIGDIADRWDAYLKETLYHGRVADQVLKFEKNEMLPLLQKMVKLGVKLDDFEQYLHNRHAPWYNKIIAGRNAQMPDGGSGIKTEDAENYMKNLSKAEKDKFESLAKDLDEITKGTQEVLLAGKLEKESTIEAWRENMPFYVPLNRNPEELDFINPGSGFGMGFGTRGSFTKAATGSTKTVIDILQNIMVQREKAIDRSEKARVGRALMGLALQAPNYDFWMPINPKAIKNKKKLASDMLNFGLTPDEAENFAKEPTVASIDKATGQVRYSINPALRGSDNWLPVRVNGEDWFLFFNPGDPRAMRMVQALKNLDANQVSEALSSIGEATRQLAAMNTQYNPVFGAWNFARDSLGAAVNIESTPIAGKQKELLAAVNPFQGAPAVRAIYNMVREKPASSKAQQEWMDVFERFRVAGGMTGYRQQFGKTEQKAGIVEKAMEKLDRSNVRKTVDSWMDWLSDYNDTMENAVRLSAFKVGLDAGLSDDRAAEIAKNVTVNFNRKGQWTANANALYAFFNANLQGTARMAQLMLTKENGKVRLSAAGKKVVAGGMLLGVTQAVLLAMAGFDEDQPPEYLKNKNFIIPLTGGKYFIIPMPLGLNVFPNIGRIVAEYALSGGKHLDKRIIGVTSAIMDTFNPLGSSGFAQNISPTVLDPIVGAFVTNKDAFGRPISKEDRGTKPTPGYERTKENASAFGKGLSYALNYLTGGGKYGIGMISPTGDQIDYLTQQYTGGVGREITKVIDLGKSAVTGEPIPSYRVPILGKLYGETQSDIAIQDKFYKNVTAMSEYESMLKRMRENKVNPKELFDDHPEAKLWSAANTLENEVNALNKQKKLLQKRNAPKERIDMIDQQKVRLMKNFNERVTKAEAQ